MKKPQSILAMSILALAILFLTCDENLTDPDDAGLQELRLGTVYQGSIDEVGEVDQFLFKPSRDMYVHFVCSEAVASSEFNPDITLYDDESNARLDSEREYGTAVITNYLVQSGKRYRIQVREWSDDRTGAYTLQLREDLDDETTLLAGQEISGEIEYVGDIDKFIIAAGNSGYYHMIVREYTVQSEYNPDVSLIDYETNGVIDSDRSYTQANIVNRRLEAGLTYILRVREWSDDQAGRYYVRYEKDPDDEILITSPPYLYQGDVQYVGDIDRFNFTPTLGGTFRIVLEERFANSDYNPAVEIYDPTNTRLGSASAYDECTIENLNLNSGVAYTINVHEWSNDAAGGYRLTIERQ